MNYRRLGLSFFAIAIAIAAFFLLEIIFFAGPTSHQTAQAAAVLTYTSYMPVIFQNPCITRPMTSPFSLQIAALHQVSATQIAALQGDQDGWQKKAPLQPLTEEAWLAAYDQAFPTLMEALKESGADWARVRINWAWIEPDAPEVGQPPTYVWGPYHDEKLRLVAETGVQLIATIADAPEWAAASACSPIYLERMADFAQFLTDLVNRYKAPPYNIKHWELFNEPDGTWSNLWVGGLGCWGNNSDQYAHMLSVAYPPIKAADPQATVLMGGVAHDWFTEYGGPFYRYFPDEVMAAGGGNYVDGLSFHYFPDFRAEWDRWDPDSPDRRNGWLPAPTCGNLFDGQGTVYETQGIDLTAKTNHFRNRMQVCYGVDKPIWVTELAEHGYAADEASLEHQARYLIQGHVRGLAAGAANITWYALTTPNDSYEQALLFDDWTPKPAFYAYKTLTTELRGYEYGRTLSITDGEGYVFQTPCGQEKIVAWGNRSLTLTAASLRVVDQQGQLRQILDGSPDDEDHLRNGQVSLQLSEAPLFISR